MQRPLCRKHSADSLFLSAYAVRFYGALQNQLFPHQPLPTFLCFYLSVSDYKPTSKYNKRKQNAGQTVYVVPVQQHRFAAPPYLEQTVQHACRENRRERHSKKIRPLIKPEQIASTITKEQKAQPLDKQIYISLFLKNYGLKNLNYTD